MKRSLWIWVCALAVAVTMAIGGTGSALAENVLTMPTGLHIIDVEAFYGDTSIGQVVLGDAVTEIRSKAFANSSLTDINLPASLTLIAEDAFDGPSKVHVTAVGGSYAHTWAVDHGYIPAAPVQDVPLGGIDDGGYRTVTVKWAAVEGAVSYNIYYGTTEDLATATEITNVVPVEGKYTIGNLEPATTYYTWVKAVSNNSISEASERYSVITAPVAPVLETPVVKGNSVTLSWDAVPTATLYRLHYGTTNDYEASTQIDKIYNTTYTLSSLEYGTTYYFWISAANVGGGVRNKNAVTALTFPSVPTLNTPIVSGNTVSLSWDAVPSAVLYRLYYGTSPKLGNATQIDKIYTTSYTLTGLDFNTTYYLWIVSANTSGGSRTPDNEPITFNTGSAVSVPHQLAPTAVISTGTSAMITFNWEEVTGATEYKLLYSLNNNASEATPISSTYTGTSKTFSGFFFGTTYYTWVKAIINGVESAPSNPQSLMTYPAMAALNEPVVSGNSVTLSWDEAQGAAIYRIRYSTSATFDENSVLSRSATGTTCTITGLDYNTTYYFWIDTYNSASRGIHNKKYKTATTGAAPN